MWLSRGSDGLPRLRRWQGTLGGRKVCCNCIPESWDALCQPGWVDVRFDITLPQHSVIGGPGVSGVEIVAQYAQNVSTIFQGTYDLISWDPRGVGLFTLYVYPLIPS